MHFQADIFLKKYLQVKVYLWIYNSASLTQFMLRHFQLVVAWLEDFANF